MSEIPKSAVKRVMQNGMPVDCRVGADAIEKMREILEAMGEEISTEAIAYAKHRGNKTVKKIDMDIAIDNISKKWVIGA